MIDVKELRIGNWVRYAHENLQVFSIYPGKITFATGNYSPDPRSIEPIPLTPEILEKCGFEFIPSGGGHKLVLNNDYPNSPSHLYVYATTKGYRGQICRSGINALDLPCDYLHSLQNLVVALTQTELKIEL